jgi:hypothetical protein
VAILVQVLFASPANNKIQEAAYILAIEADTAKAEKLLLSALDFPNVSGSEKINAHLYLAKIAEAKLDTQNAVLHYAFLKNNSQNISLVYMAAEKEKLLRSKENKIKIARVKNFFIKEKIDSADYISGCIKKGELLAQHITVYNCPDKNSLLLISKEKKTEIANIPYADVSAKVFLTFDGVFLYCKNLLYFYSLGFEGTKKYVWRMPTLEVQSIEEMGGKIYVLDINGKISSLSKNSGQTVSSVKSDGENLFKPGAGLIGTYQKNGGISVFDTLLNKLWDYQIDGEIITPPIANADSIIFGLQDESYEILNTRHYQKFTTAAGKSLDSLLAFESGNALAWHSIAEKENSDSAWKRAIIYGARNQDISQLIFDRYAKKIGAKWVRHLPVSSKVYYPRMFSDANWLFFHDEGSQSLLRFSLETGNAGGEILLPKDREWVVKDNEPPWLILSSEDWLSQFSLREQKSISLELTGMPFSFLRSRDSIYIGLLNGFVLKYFTPKMRLEWSDKVSSAPVLLSRGEKGVYSLSQGKISLLYSKTPGYKVGQEIGEISYFKHKNGMFALAGDGKVQILSEKEGFKQLGVFSVRSEIVSFELLENNGKTYALVGGETQTFSLYEIPSGTRVWTFNSKGSSYQPVLHGSHIWLDQEGSIAAIDINSGKVIKRYPIFGSGASISIQGSTLYCFTPQKLLYAFPIN